MLSTSGPTDRPLVSVVMATYNRSAVMRHAIASVRGQTLESWELIVVGDGATDDTEDVVRSIGDPRIRFVNLERRTGEQSGPNNVGISMAGGQFVAFLNHDDLWLRDHLRLCVEAMSADRAHLVIGTGACIGRRAAVPLRFDDLDVGLVGLFPGRSYSPVDGIDAVAPASGLVFRRDALELLDGWKHSRHTVVEPSQDLVFRAWRAGLRIRAVDLVTLVILAAGHRPGSYLDTTDAHAAWLYQHVVEPDRGAELAVLALETNASFVDRQPRRSWVERRTLSVLARAGVNPRAIDFRVRQGIRRGEYLDRLRMLRGVPLPGGAHPGPRLLAEMVTRSCRLEPGRVVRFAAGEPGTRLLAHGWSRPDAHGVWNDGDTASLLIDVAAPSDAALCLRLTLRPFVADRYVGPPRAATVRCGDAALAVPLDGSVSPDVVIPMPRTRRPGSRVSVTFEFTGSVSPASLGLSDDPRRIALGLVDAVIVSDDAR